MSHKVQNIVEGAALVRDITISLITQNTIMAIRLWLTFNKAYEISERTIDTAEKTAMDFRVFDFFSTLISSYHPHPRHVSIAVKHARGICRNPRYLRGRSMMKCSSISWAASLQTLAKAVREIGEIDNHLPAQAFRGASFASIATSSPMEVRTMTSAYISTALGGIGEFYLTGVFLLGAEELLNLIANLSIGNLHIVLCLAIISHQREKPVVGDIELALR